MAILDQERGQIVIRIAYDGSARSGKTTSVKALSGSLGRSVFSAGEAEGRTLFFDWLDYAGGRFEGHEIRCQIVSVPGQTVLQKRRSQLLSAADAIVFVADSTTAGLNESLHAFRFLEDSLAGRPDPRAGLIVQANKRDAADCVSLEDLRRRLRAKEIPITESVATAGVGVRETFIFAVRLALDRVRALIERKSLGSGKPAIDSGPDLLRALTLHEKETAPIESRQLPASSPSSSRAVPAPPNVAVAGGMVWPPVEGRLILQEASAAGFSPQRTTDGGWFEEKGGLWMLHSAPEDCYFDLEAGRDALIRWARIHASAKYRLSSQRCIVLSESAPGEWRLWQIVRTRPSLRALLSREMVARSPSDLAGLLLDAARLIVMAAESSRAELSTATSIIDQIAPQASKAVFISLMPSPAQPTTAPPAGAVLRDGGTRRALVRRELQAVIAQVCEKRTEHVPSLIDHLSRRGLVNEQQEVAETLAAMLLES